MNNLTRSSCSFRRQGSSGRIWTDQVFVDPKVNGVAASSNVGESRYEVAPHSHPLNSNSLSSTSTSSAKSGAGGKGHRSFFSIIFGRCMSAPPIRE
ncbi:hypothetical protein HN51_032732 [Arachis hypogaea]